MNKYLNPDTTTYMGLKLRIYQIDRNWPSLWLDIRFARYWRYPAWQNTLSFQIPNIRPYISGRPDIRPGQILNPSGYRIYGLRYPVGLIFDQAKYWIFGYLIYSLRYPVDQISGLEKCWISWYKIYGLRYPVGHISDLAKYWSLPDTEYTALYIR